MIDAYTKLSKMIGNKPHKKLAGSTDAAACYLQRHKYGISVELLIDGVHNKRILEAYKPGSQVYNEANNAGWVCCHPKSRTITKNRLNLLLPEGFYVILHPDHDTYLRLVHDDGFGSFFNFNSQSPAILFHY